MSRRNRLFILAAILSLALTPSLGYAPAPDISALAPFNAVLEGGSELVGVAVASDGTRYVSDRGAGLVYRINPAGVVSTILTNLNRPAGLAVDGTERLLIVEEGEGRLLRRETAGALTVLVSGIKTPRWIVVAPDGTVYLSAHRLTEPDGADALEGRIVVRLVTDGTVSVVASGIRQLQGLALHDGSLIAATKGLETGPDSAGVLLRYPILPQGALGSPTAWVDTAVKQPMALVRDVLGALYVSTKELTTATDVSKRAIGKLHPNPPLTDFAMNLGDPQGIALGPDGSLYLADGRAGRLLQFHAPAPPTLNAPPSFVNQTTYIVGGTTVADAQVDVFANETPTPVTAIAGGTGAFSATVMLASDVANALVVFSTTHAGNGLTSPSAEATISHDGISPALAFDAPPAGAHIRQTVTVRARGTDGSSGIASIVLLVDGQNLSAVLTPLPPAPAIAAEAAWNTLSLPDGAHTLTATGRDVADNATTVVRVVTIDNTPPDTEITGGPSGPIQGTTATFTFSGSDNLTAVENLRFSWRLDGGDWSPFNTATTATLASLAQGPHVVEVKSRDLAGNEDPTPARRSFSVGGLRITITAPSHGAAVEAGTLIVRGTIEGVVQDIGVVVNGLSASVNDSNFAAAVPVVESTTVILATVAMGSVTATDSVTVTAITPTAPLRLITTPQGGIAPFTVSFSLQSAASIVNVAADFDANGTLDFVGSTLEGREFIYAQPGLYFPRVTVTDAQGNARIVTGLVEVYDFNALDSILRAKWNALKDNLRRGDVELALNSVVVAERDAYRQLLNALTVPLANIDAVLPDVAFMSATDDRLQYQLIRVDGGVRLSYMVTFTRDGDGVWRIEFF